MNLPIGHGTSPDVGPFWATKFFIYFEDGGILANDNDGTAFRVSSYGNLVGENYSLRTPYQLAMRRLRRDLEIKKARQEADAEDRAANAQAVVDAEILEALRKDLPAPFFSRVFAWHQHFYSQ